MASQEEIFCYGNAESIVHGHHIYKTMWTRTLGEFLNVIVEPSKVHGRYAVCVKKEDTIVRRVPRAREHAQQSFKIVTAIHCPVRLTCNV